MKFRKFLSGVLSSAILILSTLPTTAYATDTEQSVTLMSGDGLFISAEEQDIECCNIDPSENYRFSNSVDNSTSSYFPPIGYQGNLNSCAGWSTTYYQYTYEVNKLKGVATTSSNTYSPAWTYNYINGGANNPAYLYDAYNILRYQGAMYFTDFPHATSAASYSYSWSTNVQKMTQALSYRTSNFYVTCPNSNSLYNAKYYLSNGKIGVIWTNSCGWTTTTTTGGETIIIRGSSNGNGGHFMTVVGYDDNITVNYNGTIFTGAFKLANSWGTENTWPDGNDGYIWVAYDALNTTGTENWDSSLTNRTQIFGSSNEINFVNVSYYPNYYVGKVTYLSNDPWRNNVYGSISTYASNSKFLPLYYYYSNGGSDITELSYPDYKVLVFDYFTSTSQDVADYINSSFTSRLYNSTSNTTYRIYHTLMDNKCKTILPNDDIYSGLPSNGGSYSRTFSVHLKKGRISTYDNNDLTSADVSLLQSYMLGSTSLSSLQYYLADMNDDDSVDVFDLALLKSALLEQNGDSINSDAILSEYIAEFNCSLRDYIFSKSGSEGVTYAENLLR